MPSVSGKVWKRVSKIWHIGVEFQYHSLVGWSFELMRAAKRNKGLEKLMGQHIEDGRNRCFVNSCLFWQVFLDSSSLIKSYFINSNSIGNGYLDLRQWGVPDAGSLLGVWIFSPALILLLGPSPLKKKSVSLFPSLTQRSGIAGLDQCGYLPIQPVLEGPP